MQLVNLFFIGEFLEKTMFDINIIKKINKYVKMFASFKIFIYNLSLY
jgi:hypothetical protein